MAKVTRTYGPIHFEDLDPHRFEDLIRELTYDYKDWQSIEATGRSGADAGFDIRAYERISAGQTVAIGPEDAEEQHPMAGNLWMIQCKREKDIGPKKLLKICLPLERSFVRILKYLRRCSISWQSQRLERASSWSSLE
jgi:hypothetical protein